jgi:hypothetical protein
MTRTKAIEHYERTGMILPGHAAEIVAYRGDDNE